MVWKSLTQFCLLLFFLALLTVTAGAEIIYNRGHSAEPQTIDPHKVSLVQEGNVAYDLFEGLLTYDAKANLIPGIAESWTVSADARTYVFKLRKDLVWSNGDPLTADDLVYSWRRVVDPATGSKYASMLFVVRNGEAINKKKMALDALGVKAIDARTFEVTLNGPTPYFLEMLAHPSTYPVPRTVVEKFGNEWVKPQNIVSNGAYILKDFIPHDSLRLVKNARYRDAGNVKIDAVNYISIEDRSVALKRFEAGEIDSYDDVPTEQVAFVKQKFPDEFLAGPYLGTYMFWMRNDKEPFSNPKLRRALSLMIDREYLAEKIWGGLMVPAYSLIPPGIAGYEPAEADFKAMAQIEREDEAKKLMAELGYGPDKPLKIEITFNSSENHRNTAIAMANMLKPIGIEAALLNSDAKTHYGRLREHGDFGLGRATWISDYRDPQTFLLIATTGDGHNYGLYSNRIYDGLVEQAATESNVLKRAAIMKEAENIVVKDQPMLILMHYLSKNLVSKRLRGWETNNMDAHFSRWLSKN